MSDDQGNVTTREIWLTVLRGGGHWKVSEIASEIGCHVDEVHKRIAPMAVRGYVRRHEKEKRLAYSIDRSCKVPVGVMVSDLMEAGAA